MANKVSLESLNKILPNRTAGKGSKKRKLSNNQRNDAVATELAKCDSAATVGYMAMKFGISEQEVRARVKSAPNFGQFRMVIGNRIRGIANKIRKAGKGKLTLTEAAYPKSAKQTKKTVKKAVKKVKKAKKAKK